MGTGIALAGILGSIFAAVQQEKLAQQVGQARFAQAADSLTESLNKRIEAYAEIAIGLRGLFIVNPTLNRRDFYTAVSHLDIDARYPGIKNIAFTRYLTAADKLQFEKQVRLDTSIEPKGYPDFNIHPPGERSEYFVADYLWPPAGNTGIHGLDISAQPANLDSMHYTMQSGKPVASAPFDLVQETTKRSGFVIRVPVFRTAGLNEPSRQDATHFLGSVAVTLRAFDLFQQLEQEGRMQGLLVNLTDVGSAISNPTATPFKRPLFTTPPASVTYGNLYSRELNLYGRKWQFDFRSARPLISESEHRASLLLGTAGILLSMLIGVGVGLLARKRTLAMQLASERGDALKLSEDRWRFAIDGSGDGLWDWDIQNNHVFYSSRWLALLGLEDDAAGHDPQVWSSHLHPQDKDRVLAQVQSHLDAQTSHYANEHRVICKDGSTKWLLGRGLVVQRDAEGRPLRMIGTNSDITERKRTEFDLQQSLLDKDALLKEVHHRVKNNLQVITSLLRLEAGRSLVTDTKEVLGYMRGRIRTLAQLHESLYRSGTFASVDLGVYLGQVATQAFKTQELHRDSVLLTLNLGSVQSGMDQATAAGLLLNELISNCLKHGFPEGQTGEVSVALQPANDQDKPPDGRWCLCVKDTGVGLPPNFEDKRKSSLGLKLVDDLSHQLGGTLVIDAVPGAGARFSVVFTVQAPVALVMPS